MPKDKAKPFTAVFALPITFFTGRRPYLQLLALIALLLGSISMVVQVIDLSSATSNFSDTKSRTDVRGSARQNIYQQREMPTTSNIEIIATRKYEEPTTVAPVAQLTVEQLQDEVVPRTKAPHKYGNVKTKTDCYNQRDMGLIAAVKQTAKHFCVDGGWNQEKQAPVSPEKATKVSIYKANGGIKSATFENLMLDLVDVSIRAPILSIAQDGGGHDPRFNFNMKLVNCACDELAHYFMSLPGDKERQAEQIWHPFLDSLPKQGIPMSTICSPQRQESANQSAWDFVKNPTKAPDNSETVVFEDPVVLVPRRDDHNPFFQISYALNAWIMLKMLDWDLTKTRVIHFDGGYPSPIDALHQGLLAPNYEIVEGKTLMGKRVHFRGNVLLAPYEVSGPMMQHLDNEEPCYESELIKTFRTQSLLTLGISSEVERKFAATTNRPMFVTVITRRPYEGRSLQRMWINEDEVMESMRTEYQDLNVEFRSIDYVKLTLYEQMKTTIESDMIISMHGAGLVNVIWSRPMTTVVEIFPKKRFRWGYRNMCQFMGCDWHEFRGGQDVGGDKAPNTKNKRISYNEWITFFHPLFREAYGAYEKQRAALHQQVS